MKTCRHCGSKKVRKGERTCNRCYKHRVKQKDPIRYRYWNLRWNAYKRGLDFSLTLQQFRDFCHSNGYHESAGVQAHEMHVDRIDAREGYHLNNIRPLTSEENGRKGATEDKDLLNGREEEEAPF